jgi:hypothetical protein
MRARAAPAARAFSAPPDEGAVGCGLLMLAVDDAAAYAVLLDWKHAAEFGTGESVKFDV